MSSVTPTQKPDVHPGWFALANGCRPSRHRPRCISADPFTPLPPTISLQPFIPHHSPHPTYLLTHIIHSPHHYSFFFIFYLFTLYPNQHQRQDDETADVKDTSSQAVINLTTLQSTIALRYQQWDYFTRGVGKAAVWFLLIQRLNTFWTAVNEGDIMH